MDSAQLFNAQAVYCAYKTELQYRIRIKVCTAKAFSYVRPRQNAEGVIKQPIEYYAYTHMHVLFDTHPRKFKLGTKFTLKVEVISN